MHVVLFDGVCALCDASVRWLIGIDHGRVLHYAPLQGETGTAVLSRHPDADASMSTVVYVRDLGSERETLYQRSDAAFAILRDLGGGWRVLSWGRLIPRAIRDALYNLIATRRYRWFGKFDICRLPGPEDDGRFLP
jgi:predicted DCC family thiol-disulfide oxidoreductase YuxK